MKSSITDADPKAPSDLQRTIGVLHLIAIGMFAAISVVTAWAPAAAQSSEVRPSYNRTITLSPSSDSDGDRVVDARDMCPGTPEGWSVKHNGCPVYQKTSSASTTSAEGNVLTGVTKIALNADILFDTGSAHITPQGEGILTRFATELKAATPTPGHKREIRLAGYADLIGRWTSNLALSQRRADAVRFHLIEQGIPSSSLQAVGYGSAAPVVQCPTGGTHAERVACLAPNRRVEIEVRQLPNGG
jgi:outer membrane protein OmpA-like peptidoglycan-associated protein